MTKINPDMIPLKIDTGLWDSEHIQGIAVDPVGGYIYYSYTMILVKARLDGTIVGWVGGLLGHLGCIDFNDEDGRVYGSLEFKHDSIGQNIMNKLGRTIASEDAFYISIFDVDKITRPNMDAEKDGVMTAVYLPQVVDWYNGKRRDGSNNPFTCSGIDGLGIGPVFGETPDSPTMLMLCSGLYRNPEKRSDNDDNIIMQYDWRELSKIAKPLSQLEPHHIGMYPDSYYFLDIANTTWGIQNLEYDAYTNTWLVAVYKGKREGSPNLPMYVIDGSVKPVPQDNAYGEPSLALTLKKEGIYHPETGIWGNRFTRGQTGVYAFGNGLYYFSYDFKTPEKKNGSIVRLCRRSGNPEVPFEPFDAE